MIVQPLKNCVSSNYDMVWKTVRATMRRRPDHEIEDIIHDAFVDALKGLSAFRGDSKFSTWVCRIAMNKARNFYNPERHPERSKTIPMPDDVIDDSEGVEEQLENQEIRRLLDDCIDLLSPPLQVVVTLNLGEKQYSEIAYILDVPIGTVRSRLSNARDVLHDCVEEKSRARPQ